MCAQPTSPDRPNQPLPVIPAPASVLPKQYRETPTDEGRLDEAKRQSARPMGLTASPGEDPMKDRGMPTYEPVRPKQRPETRRSEP
jgi:hypothetical protein